MKILKKKIVKMVSNKIKITRYLSTIIRKLHILCVVCIILSNINSVHINCKLNNKIASKII